MRGKGEEFVNFLHLAGTFGESCPVLLCKHISFEKLTLQRDLTNIFQLNNQLNQRTKVLYFQFATLFYPTPTVGAIDCK